MLPLCQIMFDRRGQMWKQWENVYDMYYREDGEKFYEVTGEPVWGWVALHCHDVQSGANGNWNSLREIEAATRPSNTNPTCTSSTTRKSVALGQSGTDSEN